MYQSANRSTTADRSSGQLTEPYSNPPHMARASSMKNLSSPKAEMQKYSHLCMPCSMDAGLCYKHRSWSAAAPTHRLGPLLERGTGSSLCRPSPA